MSNVGCKPHSVLESVISHAASVVSDGNREDGFVATKKAYFNASGAGINGIVDEVS
jgi:hypothetical protein